ncbi:MAG: aldehyde dehydrogenase family protein [Tepidisphaeraceae bacterium]
MSATVTPAVPSVSPVNAAVAPVLIGDAWQPSSHSGTFRAINPRNKQPIGDEYPVSSWPDIEAALAAADSAAAQLRALPDAGRRIADFLERYAAGIEARAQDLAAIATEESGLPVKPRLLDVELPRTINQLRAAAATARDGGWQRPTIDSKLNLRSCLAPLGPVWVIGPNNFPFAFSGIAGGDFASAIVAGNPVIAKGHPIHPGSSRILAEIAHAAAKDLLPAGTVQLLYHMSNEDGLKLVADPRLKAISFTGSRGGGLAIKAAADKTGKIFFGELSSVNPVVVLPGALAENAAGIADQFGTSMLMGTGQFCTKPGIVFVQAGEHAETFIEAVRAKLVATQPGLLFSEGGVKSITAALASIKKAGATVLAGDQPHETAGYCVPNTLLRVSGEQFLKDSHAFQTEAFGNAALVVVVNGLAETLAILSTFEGNLTGTVYSAVAGSDDAAYDAVAAVLRPRVGRLINDKMPTGVAVSPAMNHGGPFPATSQPHFTSVGFPAAALRFTQLESFDGVREHRLPACLKNANPTGKLWRLIDGNWTADDVKA